MVRAAIGPVASNHGANSSAPEIDVDVTYEIMVENDGSRLMAAAGGNGNSGFVFIATNSGAAWKLIATNIVGGLTARPWIGVASSADGSKLAAVSDSPSPLGLITSTDSGDLPNWTDISNVPVSNFTNLENQVALPSTSGNSFFRLKH